MRCITVHFVTIKYTEKLLVNESYKIMCIRKMFLDKSKNCKFEKSANKKNHDLSTKKIKKKPKKQLKIKICSPLAFPQLAKTLGGKVCLTSERFKRKEKTLCYRIQEFYYSLIGFSWFQSVVSARFA